MEWERLLSDERLRASTSEKKNDRSEYERDYDRIIFSKPFRRLQKKTQVFPLPEHDFIHTRLTHSLETACVGRSLGMAAGAGILSKEPKLKKFFTAHDFAAVVYSASVAHDIGNPPFGHSGENAISDFFKSTEGKRLLTGLSRQQKLDLQKFEGNAMGFRLMAVTLDGVSKIKGGMNLTYATLGAFTKYPCESKHAKTNHGVSEKKYGFFQSEKVLFAKIAKRLGLKKKHSAAFAAYHRHPLAFLVEAADDISYLLMDYEDGFNLKIISEKEITEAFQCLLAKEFEDNALKKFIDVREKVAYLRACAITNLINQSVEVFLDNLPDIMTGKFDSALKDHINNAEKLKKLKDECVNKVYSYRKVLEIEAAGYEVIGGLLHAFLSALKSNSGRSKKIKSLLPRHYLIKDIRTPEQWYHAILHIVQFVAGMTDTFAIDTYRTIKGIRLPTY